MTSSGSAQQNLLKAIMLLTCSAFLFSLMGVCVGYASETVDNATVVFFRNFIGLFIFIPFIFNKGLGFFKTEKLWMHTWRSVVGLTAMYGFFLRDCQSKTVQCDGLYLFIAYFYSLNCMAIP